MKLMTIKKLKSILINRKKMFSKDTLYPNQNILHARIQGEIDCMDFVLALLNNDGFVTLYCEQYYLEKGYNKEE